MNLAESTVKIHVQHILRKLEEQAPPVAVSLAESLALDPSVELHQGASAQIRNLGLLDRRRDATGRWRWFVSLPAGVELRRLAEVAEQEKMRLSREIHDVLGQELTGLWRRRFGSWRWSRPLHQLRHPAQARSLPGNDRSMTSPRARHPRPGLRPGARTR